MFNLTLKGEYERFLSCSVSENIRQKGAVCVVDWMAVPLTVSHLLHSVGMRCYPFLCVIALRALQEGGPITGAQSSAEQQQRVWTVKCPLAGLRPCGISFLSGNMTSAGRKLSLGSINTATFLGCRRSSCAPTAPSCRKERWRRTYARSLPQESPSMHEEELE